MFFSGATDPGTPGKPNEDRFAATSDILVVLDGATVRTDTGCKHGVSWYVKELTAAIIAAAAEPSLSLREILAEAIGYVASLHPSCDLSHPGTPSAGVAIVRFEDDTIRYLVLGDVSLIIDQRDGEVIEVVDHRVSKIAADERRAADQYLIGDPRKTAALQLMKVQELAARNVSGGYWIAAADPAAVAEAIVDEIPATAIRQLALMSDGAARIVELFGALDWRQGLSLLSSQGPTELIRRVRAIELDDVVGEEFPRNKASDDATVVYAKLMLDS